MKRLGYTRYVAQGGDWGAPVSSAMARQNARRLARHPYQFAGDGAARSGGSARRRTACRQDSPKKNARCSKRSGRTRKKGTQHTSR